MDASGGRGVLAYIKDLLFMKTENIFLYAIMQKVDAKSVHNTKNVGANSAHRDPVF